MSRIHSLDYLKLLLAVLVAFGHSGWMQAHASVGMFILGNGILRVIVPLFSIVTGYFLYHSLERGKALLWLGRLLALYALWMVLYLPFWIGAVTGTVSLIKMLIFGYFHLWFLSGMIIGGAAIVILRHLSRWAGLRSEVRPIIAAAVICALIGLGLQYLNLSMGGALGQRKYQNGLFFCLPFLSMGYLWARVVADRGVDALPSGRVALWLSVTGMALLAFEAYELFLRSGMGATLEIPISSYIAVPGLFLLALRLRMPEPPLQLDPLYVQIYFMHVMTRTLATHLGIRDLAGLMFFGVVVPAITAIVFDRLGLPAIRKHGAGGTEDGRQGRIRPL